MLNLKTSSRLSPGLLRFGLFLIVLTIPVLYSGSSAASFPGPARNPAPASHATPDLKSAAGGALVRDALGTAAAARAGLGASLPVTPLRAMFQEEPPPPPIPEDIAAFADDCTTPKTTFAAGETVCAKASGTFLGPRVIYWINPEVGGEEGGIVQTDIVSPTSLTATRVVNTRGQWRLYLSAGDDGTLRKANFFSVSDPAEPSVDLSIHNTIDQPFSSFAAGHDITYLVTVVNNGPDAATNVDVTVPAPNNSTLSSSSQTSGPACAPSGADAAPCRIASLAAGQFAEFKFVYTVNTGTAKGTEISNTATVVSATEELHAPDNSATTNVAITGEVTAPVCVLTCPANITVTANATQAGQPGAFVNHSAAGVSGDCGAVTNSPASGSFLAVGTHTITSTSEAGSNCTFTVNVVDTAAPTISCPASIIVTDTDNSGDETVSPGTPTFTAASGGTVTGVRSDSTPAVTDEDGTIITPATTVPLSAPYPVGTTGILWTVTDSTGRTASCSQKIVVKSGACATDTQNPTIVAPPDVNIGTGAGNTGCGVALDDELGQAEVEDNCSVNVTVTGIPAGNIFVPGTPYTLTYTATDGSGNTATDTQIVTVTDNTPPAIEAPADATYTCPSEVPTANPSQATRGEVLDEDGNPLPPGPPFENCGTAVVTVVDTNNGGAGSATSPLIITRTYTATDAANNSASDSQTITVADGTAPTITAPADAAYQCASEVPAAAASQATAADNCAAPNVAVADASNGGAGSPASPLVITRTYTATDAAGNTASDSQTITVIDTTAPVITLAGNNPQVVECHTSYVEAGATASDNCSANFAATPSGAVNVNVPGAYTVTYNATDAAGNAATPVTRTVNVVDTTAPVMSCPANIVVYLPLNSTAVSMPVSFPAPTATDSCDASVPVTTSHASGSVFNVGTTTVTASATDDSNNSASCNFSVTVLYNFTGFFAPVDNLPTLNEVKAGQSVPVKFSLSGNKGLAIFAANSPASGVIPCDPAAPVDDIEETVTAGGSTLQYDAATDRYSYIWKTNKAWANTCRQLMVTLNDGSVHNANFKFKP